MSIDETDQGTIHAEGICYLRELEEFCNHRSVQTEYQYLICPQPCISETWEFQICSCQMDTTYRSHDWEVNILGNFFWCYCFTEDQAIIQVMTMRARELPLWMFASVY